jgi:hypothetical protein
MAKRRTHRDEPRESIEATVDDTIVRANVNRQAVMSPTFATIYANDVQVQTTPWDVRLIFGEIFQAPTKDEPTAVIKQVGELRMSPQLTKKVVQILRQQLDVYERRFGQIPMVPED